MARCWKSHCLQCQRGTSFALFYTTKKYLYCLYYWSKSHRFRCSKSHCFRRSKRHRFYRSKSHRLQRQRSPIIHCKEAPLLLFSTLQRSTSTVSIFYQKSTVFVAWKATVFIARNATISDAQKATVVVARKATMVTAAVTAVNVTPVTPDVKRGRGRPHGKACPRVSVPHASGVKRSPGRPPIAKRPRGRPRVGTKKPPSMNNDEPTPVTNTTTTSTPTSRSALIIGTVGEAKLVSSAFSYGQRYGFNESTMGAVISEGRNRPKSVVCNDPFFVLTTDNLQHKNKKGTESVPSKNQSILYCNHSGTWI